LPYEAVMSRLPSLALALAFALVLAGCVTPPPQPITYTGTPQEQWVQGQKAYLDWNARRPGWTTTASGLQHRRIKAAPASAPKASEGATVTIHYVGRFIDGRVFDSSRERGEPATFPLPRLIRGWQEGVPLMRVGEVWEFVIPADLAYGDRTDRGPIPPGSALLFEIELVALPQG
jgi:FKBP-type peptidyl-prolyl cis-trans isomerase FkpA